MSTWPADGRLRLELLGRWRLRTGEDGVVLPTTARRLVALLALSGPRSRAFVAGSLWPDGSDALAMGNLRATVSRLRKLQPELLVTEPGMLALSSCVSVDVHHLQDLADEVLHGYDDVPEGALAGLADAELLPGWYDDFVLLHRERLEQLRLHALETLADRLCAQGDYPDAVGAALAAVHAEPLRESSHRALIRVHLAEGNHAAAIRQFRAFRDLVRRELGLEPSPRMAALLAAARVAPGGR
jgi:DNA-binding SARP family transcriptional activator